MKVIWVSERDGSDLTGNGSKEYPYATIEKAITVFVDKDQIRLDQGTYTPTDSVVVSGVEGSIFSEFPLGATIQPQKTRAHAGCIAILDSPRFSVVGVRVLQAADTSGNTVGIYFENAENILCWTCEVSDFNVPSGNAHGIFASGDGRVENCTITNFHGGGQETYGIRTKGVSVIDCEAQNVSGLYDCKPIHVDGQIATPSLHAPLFVGGSISKWDGVRFTSFTDSVLNGEVINSIAYENENNVWAVGGTAANPKIFTYDGTTWSEMTGLPANMSVDGGQSVQAVTFVGSKAYVGTNNRLFTYENSIWTEEFYNGAAAPKLPIYGVHPVRDDLIFFAGSLEFAGNTYAINGYWDGVTLDYWPDTDVPNSTLNYETHGIWGTSLSSAWSVGKHVSNGTGRIWSTDGVDTTVDKNTADEMYDIWGANVNNIWAVGANGIIEFWNGSTWTTYESPVSGLNIRHVSGIDVNNVWATGDLAGYHYIIKYNSNTDAWETVYSASGSQFTALGIPR